MFLGHLAAAALIRHYCQTEGLPTLGGSLAPDLADKTLYSLGAVNSSRTFGHTLMGAAVSTAVIHLIWGKGAARGWLLGYLGHLLADASGFVPWFYPWKRYAFHPNLPRSRPYAQFIRLSPLELPLLLWTIYVYSGRRDEKA